MRRSRSASRREPTTALINIVFLILIFFMVAGTLSGPLGESIEFVETRGLDCCAPPDALAISADGALTYKGAALGGLGDCDHENARQNDLESGIEHRHTPPTRCGGPASASPTVAT